MLDLDLEAPGLRQFQEFRLRKDRRGFLDYADFYSRNGKCDAIEGFLHKCEVSFDEGELWLMPSGKRDAGYQDRLADLSWRRLHAQAGTMPFIEELQKQVEAHARPHYVLIDARTGLSDIGGLSTNRMANMVVLVFNLTRGCIEGSAEACNSFLHRDSRPDVVQLMACPVPPSAGGKKDRVEEQLAFAAKEMSEALRYGRQIVRVDYDPAMVLAEELAVTDRGRYPAAQRYDELREIIQRANPGEVWVVLDDARELRKGGRIDEAIERLRAFAEGTKDNAEGWLELGRFLLESGRSQEAVDAFRKSCGVAPRFSAPHHGLGEALLAADQAREAVKELEEARRLGGASQDLLGLLAAAYAETGDTERYAEARRRYAADLFGSLTSSETSGEPDPSQLHQEFVEVAGLRPPYSGFDAGSFWQLLMGSPSGSITDKANLARALLEGNLSAKRILEIERDLKEEQKQFAEVFGSEYIRVHQRIAEGLLDPQDKDSLQKALRGDTSDALVLRWVATVTSDPDEKIEHLRKAFAIAPDDRRVLNDLLRSFASRASIGDVDRWAGAAIELIQEFNWADTTDSEIELATGVAMGRLIELAPSKDLLRTLARVSIERCARAAVIDPDSHEALFNWGIALSYLAKVSEGEMQRQYLLEARDHCHRANAIQPHAADYNLACAHSLLGEHKSAADLLVQELLRRRDQIDHALGDSDLNPVWSAFPDLHAAVEACRAGETLAPLEEWLERRETSSEAETG